MVQEQDNKLPFLDVLVTRTEQGFRPSVYCKPTFTGQYLIFNCHHPYTVKKGIVRCFNMTENCVYSIPCSCGKIYKGETGRPQKVRLKEHGKADEIEKLGMADHIGKEKGNHLPLWDKVEIID